MMTTLSVRRRMGSVRRKLKTLRLDSLTLPMVPLVIIILDATTMLTVKEKVAEID